MSSNKVVVKEFNLLGPNEVYLFDDVSQREALVQCLQVFRREKLFCDVSLRVNESKIAAHRNILSASSPYFKTLFLESETGKFIKNVPLPDDMSLTTTEAVLDYMYGGKVYLTDENCMDILKAASFFQLQSLTRECCYALVTFLTPENCLKIRDLALSLGQTELYERSLRFVWSNFADVVQQRTFLEVSRHTLEDLLSSDNIHVANELQVPVNTRDASVNFECLYCIQQVDSTAKCVYDFIVFAQLLLCSYFPELSPTVETCSIHWRCHEVLTHDMFQWGFIKKIALHVF